MSHHGQPSRRSRSTTKKKHAGLSFNIAVTIDGDMQIDDHLAEFLRDTEPVNTNDHTQTVLVNAVKDMLQNPDEPPTLLMNQISSLNGESFLRVDASIWIGVPGAPGNWEVPSVKEGWHQNGRRAILKHVGHPVANEVNPLTSPSKHSFDEEVREGEMQQQHQQQQQQTKRKRQRRVMGSDGGNGTSYQPKRQKVSAPDQERAWELPVISREQVNKSTEEDFLTTPLKSEGPGYDCNVVPSSVLDDDILGVAEEPLFPELDIGAY